MDRPLEHDGRPRELERQATELAILQRVSTDINSTLDLEEVYDIALRTMGDLFDFHHATILIVEPGGEMLRVVASRGYEDQAIGGRVPIGTGVIGIVAAKRRPLQVGNLGQQRAYAAAQRRQMLKAGRSGELGDVVPVPGLPNAESQIAIPLLAHELRHGNKFLRARAGAVENRVGGDRRAQGVDDHSQAGRAAVVAREAGVGVVLGFVGDVEKGAHANSHREVPAIIALAPGFGHRPV